MSDSPPARLSFLGLTLGVLASAASAGLAGWITADTLRSTASVTSLVGRASGLSAYVLLVALVSVGLILSHPWSRRLHRPHAATRLALHISLATFTLVFTTLHVVVVATEPSNMLGWHDLVLPFASTHRPVPRTLGVLAVWSGLITGITARFAGRFASRLWWPVHKVAIVAFLLTWAHSVIAGSDTPTLRWFYLTCGMAVLGLAVTRYSARTPADLVEELTRAALEHVPAEPLVPAEHAAARPSSSRLGDLRES
ncbi:MAG: hypothetical protein ACOH2F_16015 [Cellulomonas sp.]